MDNMSNMSSLANAWFGSKTGVFARAVKKVPPLTLSCVGIIISPQFQARYDVYNKKNDSENW